MVAHTDGKFRRTNTATGHFLQRRLGNAVFQRMEGDNGNTATWLQMFDCRAKSILQNSQFIVDFNADCLENALSRMTVCGLADSLWHGFADNIHQFASRLYRFYRPLFDDKLRNAASPTLLSVIMENTVEIFLTVGIDHIISRKACFRVHPHIERCILHIRKPALCRINLM